MLGAIKKFFSRTDWVLLGLCLAASVFGIIAIASASNYHGASTYVSKQIIALVLGIFYRMSSPPSTVITLPLI